MHDINLSQLTGAVTGKGNKYASITFSEKAKDHLEAYLTLKAKLLPYKSFTYVFTPYAKKERIISEQGLNTMVKNIGIKAGIKKTTNVHLYRHTLATHLIQNGCTIVQVRDKLRHSCISISNRYTHSNPTELLSVTQKIDSNM